MIGDLISGKNTMLCACTNSNYTHAHKYFISHRATASRIHATSSLVIMHKSHDTDVICGFQYSVLSFLCQRQDPLPEVTKKLGNNTGMFLLIDNE